MRLIASRCKTCAYRLNTKVVMCYIKPGYANEPLYQVLFNDL